jgi:predicted RNA-binding protein YlqC (UPF0109 family)
MKKLSPSPKAPVPSEQRSGRALLQSAKSSGTVGATNELTMQALVETDPITEAVETVNFIVGHLADEPENVRCEVTRMGYTQTVIEIHANATDYGNILGGGAKILKGIQAIVAIIGRKQDASIRVTMEQEPGGEKRPKAFQPRDDWRKEEFQRVIEQILELVFDEVSVTIVDGKSSGNSLVEVFVPASESEDRVKFMQERIIGLVSALGVKFGRMVRFVIVRDTMLYEQTLSAEKRDWQG